MGLPRTLMTALQPLGALAQSVDALGDGGATAAKASETTDALAFLAFFRLLLATTPPVRIVKTKLK